MRGLRHSLRRDRDAISHHYDVGNDFYALLLGPTLVYSCAYFAGPDTSLDDAQVAKLDLVCRKLDLRPGMRLLDVGCGWGSLVLHAAANYGVDAVGVTISPEQADLARRRIAKAGLDDRVEIRLQDYREVSDGTYDAIASVGMAEHVGRAQLPAYAAGLHALLAPGGRLLKHALARGPAAGPDTGDARTFVARYVFPDGELQSLADTSGSSNRPVSRCGTSKGCGSTTPSRAAPGSPTCRPAGRRRSASSPRPGRGCGGSTWPAPCSPSRGGGWA